MIAKRLGSRVTPNQVRAAIERLSALKLIRFSSDGKFTCTADRVTTADDVANLAARKYHKQVMELASVALDQVPLEKREFQSFSISIPNAKRSLAKELIRKFRTQFANAIGLTSGDEVYQMSIQLFQLTESPEQVVCPEDAGVGTESGKTTTQKEFSHV